MNKAGQMMASVVAVGPAVLLVVIPSVGAVGFTWIESVRGSSGVSVYRELLSGQSLVSDFWHSAAFSLMVGLVSTVLAGFLALILVSWWDLRRSGSVTEPTAEANRSSGGSLAVYGLVISVPHLAWAAALSLWLAQSGLLARLAHLVGLIDVPSDFPVLVEDPYGLGLVVHYVTKETPFIVVAAVAAVAARPPELHHVAMGLGAGWWQRARLITWPMVRPAMLGAMLVSFGFALHSVQAPKVLGATRPRMMSVVAAELFSEPTIDRRATAAAVGLMVSAVAVLFAALGAWSLRRSRSNV